MINHIYTEGLHMLIRGELLEKLPKEHKIPADFVGKAGIIKGLPRRL